MSKTCDQQVRRCLSCSAVLCCMLLSPSKLLSIVSHIFTKINPVIVYRLHMILCHFCVNFRSNSDLLSDLGLGIGDVGKGERGSERRREKQGKVGRGITEKGGWDGGLSLILTGCLSSFSDFRRTNRQTDHCGTRGSHSFSFAELQWQQR